MQNIHLLKPSIYLDHRDLLPTVYYHPIDLVIDLYHHCTPCTGPQGINVQDITKLKSAGICTILGVAQSTRKNLLKIKVCTGHSIMVKLLTGARLLRTGIVGGESCGLYDRGLADRQLNLSFLVQAKVEKLKVSRITFLPRNVLRPYLHTSPVTTGNMRANACQFEAWLSYFGYLPQVSQTALTVFLR